MITNYIKRYAEDLRSSNDIACFDKIFLSLDGVSAVSWEWQGHSRREYGEELLRNMFSLVNHDGGSMNVMVQLVPEQPNTAMVKYKKTWGLIESCGLNLNLIENRMSFIDKGCNGLILSGFGSVSSDVTHEIEKLINSEERLFFSNLTPDFDFSEENSNGRLSFWINSIIRNDGLVFFHLGSFDEKDSEVVVVGKKYNIRKFYD
ncbi:hypothetical protein [Pantoea coffeiphila]|uniref:hypothetical protein n=1 Tax=Pantoea coffeiphila TaxID=1465635 RepID=UPI00196191DB|nr:hypothetical protein [Pantoea coffeiphila]MBM7341242.1 hypothetical protein [Pantoea coffeiphila]